LETQFAFGPYRIDATARRLYRGGAPIAVEPRPFDLLVHLVRHRNRVVSREELIDCVWSGASATASAVARAVMKLRDAISPANGEEFIRTVTRVGYRFAGTLQADAADRAGGGAAAGGSTVALLPVRNATGDSSLDWLEFGVMALAARQLQAQPGLALVAISSMTMAIDGARAAQQTDIEAAVQRATGARFVVRGRVRQAGQQLRLDYQVEGGEQPVHGAVSATGPVDLANVWSEALIGALCPDGPRRELQAPSRDPLADEAFARGMHALAVHRWSKATNLFRLALELDPEHADAELELLRAQGNMGDTELVPRALTLLERARTQNDTMLAARVHQALGRMHLLRSEIEQGEHHLAQSLCLADSRGGPDWTARTLMLQASASNIRLQHARAREIVAQMYVQCDLSGDRVLRVAGQIIEAIAAAGSGDTEQAAALSIAAARRAGEVHAHSYRVNACDTAAINLARLGRLTEAAAHAEESVATACAFDDIDDAWSSIPTLCWIYKLARMPEAAAHALGRMPERADLLCPEQQWRAHAVLAAAQGRHSEAAEGLRRAVHRQREQQFTFDEEQTLPWLIDALVLTGCLDEAEAELAQAESLRFATSVHLRAQALHGRALLAHARGRTAEARQWLEQVVDTASAPLWRAWACIDLAWLAAEAGEVQAGARLLDKVPDALASHPLASAARRRLRDSEGPLPARLPHLATRL